MAEHDDQEPGSRPGEAIFQSLPPLGSPEYLTHIDRAAASDLPPEVLVRAFRQLPAGSLASRATLDRLFRRRERRWDYLGPLAKHARDRARSTEESEELLQDALARILSVLGTTRGTFAEVAWHTFCRHEFSEAWRQRYGRRGERISPEETVGVGGESEPSDPLELPQELPPWHGLVAATQTKRIEELARRVVDRLDDGFVREVATAAWFADARPRVSGWEQPGEPPPLTSVFPGKSRFQIKRALERADRVLAAELIADRHLDWTAEAAALLRRLSGDARPARDVRSQEHDA